MVLFHIECECDVSIGMYIHSDIYSIPDLLLVGRKRLPPDHLQFALMETHYRLIERLARVLALLLQGCLFWLVVLALLRFFGTNGIERG
jgi:hypothetical protein